MFLGGCSANQRTLKIELKSSAWTCFITEVGTDSMDAA